MTQHRLIVGALTLWLLASGCTGTGSSTESSSSSDVPPDPESSTTPSGPSPTPEPKRGRIIIRRVAGELEQPVAFTFDAGGRIWVAEKSLGDVLVIDPDTGRRSRFFTVPDLAPAGEQGLVGIALDPGYPSRAFVYLFATRSVDGELVDQVLRLEDVGGLGTGLRVLLSVPASLGHAHSGGRILFGPDAMLYAVFGDGLQPELAQDPSSLRGKVVRIDPDGDPQIFASGIRNSFGLAFDPGTGTLWETENGPECTDEVNLVVEHANLGWGPAGNCTGPDPASTNADGSRPVMPQVSFTPTIAPTGLAFCDGCHLGRSREGDLFYGAFNGGLLGQAVLSADRSRIVDNRLVPTRSATILSMERGSDGSLYYSTFVGIFRLSLAP